MKHPLWLKLLSAGFALVLATTGPVQGADATATKFSQEELENLVAPIALYPDPLLAQILPASTYPLEIVQAARVVKDENDFNKIDAQSWDASVKAVARYPVVLKKMSEDLEWTQQLGQAVLTQQADVMKSIQSLREQAKAAGNLKTTQEQVVRVESSQIEILPTSTEVIYVPVYNPRIVYVRQLVPVAYPLITFGYGFRFGWWLNVGFYWPSHSIFYCGPHYWRPGWHGTYVRNTAVVHNHTTNIYNNTHTTWAHNPSHGNPFNGRKFDKRGGAVTTNRKFGGHIATKNNRVTNNATAGNPTVKTSTGSKTQPTKSQPSRRLTPIIQKKNEQSFSQRMKMISHSSKTNVANRNTSQSVQIQKNNRTSPKAPLFKNTKSHTKTVAHKKNRVK